MFIYNNIEDKPKDSDDVRFFFEKYVYELYMSSKKLRSKKGGLVSYENFKNDLIPCLNLLLQGEKSLDEMREYLIGSSCCGW